MELQISAMVCSIFDAVLHLCLIWVSCYIVLFINVPNHCIVHLYIVRSEIWSTDYRH
jgi:hypothetical protein